MRLLAPRSYNLSRVVRRQTRAYDACLVGYRCPLHRSRLIAAVAQNGVSQRFQLPRLEGLAQDRIGARRAAKCTPSRVLRVPMSLEARVAVARVSPLPQSASNAGMPRASPRRAGRRPYLAPRCGLSGGGNTGLQARVDHDAVIAQRYAGGWITNGTTTTRM